MSIIAKYDVVQPLLNKSKPYIDIKNKNIVCNVDYRKYYSVVQRYNNFDKCYDYFIIHTNEEVTGYRTIGHDMFGKTKFNISSIWDNLKIDSKNDFNISFDKVDSDNTTNVYKIDF